MGEDDLRGDIASALGDTGDDSTEVVVETPERSGDGESPKIPAASEHRAATPAESPAPEGDGKVRDSLGRFVPKAKEPQEGPGAAPGTPGATPPVLTPPAAVTAVPAAAPPVQSPQSWSPLVRDEHWAKLPPAVQQEVLRREQEVIQAFRSVAPARQLGEQFHAAIQPYMPAIQAEGVEPITAVTNLMQFATRMRMGTMGEKAATLAQIVNTYGVDINALDSALAGVAPQAQADPRQAVNQAVQQALLPIYQAAQQRQQMVAQQADGAARTELEAFAANPKNRFFNDLRNDMADMVDMAANQGRDLSLQEAYDRAGMLHPEISKIMIAERQGANAQQLTAAAQKAKASAVSVRGTAPVGNPGGPEPSSIRESIEAAIEAHSRY